MSESCLMYLYEGRGEGAWLPMPGREGGMMGCIYVHVRSVQPIFFLFVIA